MSENLDTSIENAKLIEENRLLRKQISILESTVTSLSMKDRPKYAIINHVDYPGPRLVVQWVSGIGYCYLHRALKSYDGMIGPEATDVRDFGLDYVEDLDSTVTFTVTDRASTATYTDGRPRRWQDPFEKTFTYSIIKPV